MNQHQKIEPQMPLNDYRVNDPAEFSRNMVKVAAQSQRLVTDFMKGQARNGKPDGGGSHDPLNLGQTVRRLPGPGDAQSRPFRRSQFPPVAGLPESLAARPRAA